jgi:WD40 repeat protein
MKVSLIHTLIGHEAAIYKLIPGQRAGIFISCGGEGYVVEWDPFKSEKGQLLARDTDSLYCMNMNDHNQLFLGTKNGMFICCTLDSTREIRKLDIHKKGIYSIAVNEDFVFTAGGDGWLRVLNRLTLSLIYSLQLSAKSLRSVILMPDIDQLIVAGSERKLFLLDALRFDLISSNDSTHDNSVFCMLRSSPDKFYSAGRDARLSLNIVENSIVNLASVPAHMNTINDLALNQEASLLATASRDRTIKIWSPGNLGLLKVIDGFKYKSHTHSINAVLWLDSETLVSAGDDRLIKVWKIED